MTYFGTNIKKIRQIKGLSQQAFAEILQLTRGVISSYEEGRAEPKIETLLKIANFLEISTDNLISKPLTVNQLANFNDLESIIIPQSVLTKSDVFEICSNGVSNNLDLQKILAKFDFIFEVNEKNCLNIPYQNGDILFLKKNSKEGLGDFLIIENGKVLYGNHNLANALEIIGKISSGKENFNIIQDLVSRIEKLEGRCG